MVVLLNRGHSTVDDRGVVTEEEAAERRGDAEEDDALPPQFLLRRFDQQTLRCR